MKHYEGKRLLALYTRNTYRKPWGKPVVAPLMATGLKESVKPTDKLRAGDSGDPGDMARTEFRLRRRTGRRRFLRMWLARGVRGCNGDTTGCVGCCACMVVATSRIGS
jgi:hypothetical protein